MAEVAKMPQFSDLRTKLADKDFMKIFISEYDPKTWYPILQKSFSLSEHDAKKLAKELLEIRK